MTSPTKLTPADLRDIQTYADAVDILCENGALTDAQLLDLTGFGLLPGDQKATLVGVPFLIIEFTIKPGIHGNDYAEILLVTTTDYRWRMRDSSLGINKQLKEILVNRIAAGHPTPNLGIEVRKGLRYQEFEYLDTESGKVTYPRTYFLQLD
ncbi:MAG: hypothetical protein ACRDUW_03370 [Pseudonocardiaceae bacterium]